MALAASKEINGSAVCALKRISFRSPLFLRPGESQQIQLAFSALTRSFEINSRSCGKESSWVNHADGQISLLSNVSERKFDLVEIAKRCAKQISKENCYTSFSKIGL